MATDSPDEKRRLQSLYSSMTEGELREVAGDAESLTAEAVQALQHEISRRGLELPIVVPALGMETVQARELVTVRRFRDLPEAVLAKGLLESAGIECFLLDDNIVRMDWFWSNGVGGIKLQVDPEDADSAIDIFLQPIPEDFEVEGIGGFHQPRCPVCGSVDTTFQELYKPIAYTSAWLRVPVPVHLKAWRCRSCAHEWENPESEETEIPR
jgi:Putative prokaryotic signal transducing protein